MTPSNYELIASAFTACDIAEPIRMIFPPEEPLSSLWEQFIGEKDNWEKDRRGLVRDAHHTYGYLDFEARVFEAPVEGLAREKASQIGPEIIVSALLPLLELVPLFEKSSFYFVLARNEITHIVTFNDLDKLPFKCSLFSLILELESQLIELLKNDPSQIKQYLNLLPENRFSQAKDLCIDKYGKDQETPYRLLLCTTFIDKKTMLMKSPHLINELQFESNTKLDELFKRVERVRNQIAHSDSILKILRVPNKLIGFVDNLPKLTTAIANLKKKLKGD
jgi:hypothetical protein